MVGFKSFFKDTKLTFPSSIVTVVGPNGSGKSNVVEAFRFVLGEQSMKSMRGKKGSDFIFSGPNNRLNRAAVEVVFDNSDNFFDIDYDEVSAERVVTRDGTNEYYINGTQVRLKDIVELFVKANIGTTGHNIISQGEADKVLNASTEMRKDMLEESLGLRFFSFKKTESLKKIEKTKENVKEIALAKREIVPHLKFLEKQVDKIKRADELRKDLSGLYEGYLSIEDLYIKETTKKVIFDIEEVKNKLEVVGLDIKKEKKTASGSKDIDKLARESEKIQIEIRKVRTKKEDILRNIGFIEGEIRGLSRMEDDSKDVNVSVGSVEKARDEIIKNIKADVPNIVERVRGIFSKLLVNKNTSNRELGILKDKKIKEDIRKDELFDKENELQDDLDSVHKKQEYMATESMEAERMLYQAIAKKTELESNLDKLKSQQDNMITLREEFNREVNEGTILISEDIYKYKDKKVSNINEPRSKQLIRRRELEKIKIRLEELGTDIGKDTMKEYNEVLERDLFLQSELEDLTNTIKSLEKTLESLEKEIKTRFDKGFNKINKQFNEFFNIMFGGGSASIKIVKEKRGEETIEGIDLTVNLPRKKIKSLHQLSGGERALTSIALLFSMSQVSPPPFLILDETDAALDEANSKRYGDMIERLSKKSQLILVTHNRETMSRSGIIYGVTMARDGASQLLSIKLEEAVKIAK